MPTKNNAHESGQGPVGNDMNLGKETVMTSLTTRWARVSIDVDSIAAEMRGPLIVIDNGDDVVSFPLNEAEALISDIQQAVADVRNFRTLRRPQGVDEHFLDLDN